MEALMVQLCEKSDLLVAAESYLAAGLCVLPARLDKKYPLLDTWGRRTGAR